MRKFPEEYSFLPKTYVFKHDFDAFMANKKSVPYWIIKPVDSARGIGIKVVSCDDKFKYDKGKKVKLISRYSRLRLYSQPAPHKRPQI